MSTKPNVAMVRADQRDTESGAEAESRSRPTWISEDLFPFRSRFIDVGAARLHYIDEGSGPTLLFLHGSPMWSFMFRHAIGALRSRFRCVALDMPGLGLSTAPLVRGHAFEETARYYEEFVRQLDLNGFIAIAHATAGPPCMRMATRDPRRIVGLVITNSLAWPMSEFPSMWRFVRIVSSAPFRFAAIHLNLLPLLTARIARRTGKFNQAERAAILGPYRQLAARRHLANMLFGLRAETAFFRQLESDLSALQALPVLLLYGAKDNGYQAGFVERWQRLMPRNSVALLEHSAHFPTEDEPEAYTAALTSWVDQQMPARRISAPGDRG